MCISASQLLADNLTFRILLQQRDPGRTFVLGERLQYVLLPGAATQDEAAEDPLTAAKAGAPANFELYWRNKLHRPLSELFATCLSPTALQHLLNGPHTLVKVDLHSSARSAVPGSKKQSKGRQTGLNQFFKGDCCHAAAMINRLSAPPPPPPPPPPSFTPTK